MTRYLGADEGAEYTGDLSTYAVTILQRDTRMKTALVKIERLIRSHSTDGHIPAGVTITVPLGRVTLKEKTVATVRKFSQQKAALTRAVNSGDPEKVKAEVIRTRDEWESPEWKAAHGTNAWPDDWSRWQRALDDALPWNEQVGMELI